MTAPNLISDWANGFAKLYSKQDLTRSPEEMWIATMAHCSSIGEAIRKSDYVELMFFACKVFCWMLSFSVRIKKDPHPLFRIDNEFCDIVYFKFPEVCGHCTDSQCTCQPVEMDAKKDKAGKYKKLLEKWERAHRGKGNSTSYSIADWLKIFTDIYGGRIHLQTLETLGFHFLEEAGEEAFAIRKLIQLRGALGAKIAGLDEASIKKLTTIPNIAKAYISLGKGKLDGKPHFKLNAATKENIFSRIVDAKMDLMIELADAFSFFCSILIKLSKVTIAENKHFVADLESRLIKMYGEPKTGLICPECKKDVCDCSFFSNIDVVGK